MNRLIIFLTIIFFSCENKNLINITVLNQTNFIEKSNCKITLNDTIDILFKANKTIIADKPVFDTIINFPINKINVLIEKPYKIETTSYFDKKLKKINIHIEGEKIYNFEVQNHFKKTYTHYLDSFLFYPQIKVYPTYY